jgi:hypothetical protein
MITIRLLLLVLAAICFALDSYGVGSKIGLQSLGLFLITVAWLVG